MSELERLYFTVVYLAFLSVIKVILTIDKHVVIYFEFLAYYGI
tara:strand:- start:1118 stop:1246 length:129 start_codon:yes stop_codon:yes gene_type:complete